MADEEQLGVVLDEREGGVCDAHEGVPLEDRNEAPGDTASVPCQMWCGVLASLYQWRRATHWCVRSLMSAMRARTESYWQVVSMIDGSFRR